MDNLEIAKEWEKVHTYKLDLSYFGKLRNIIEKETINEIFNDVEKFFEDEDMCAWADFKDWLKLRKKWGVV